MALTFQVPMQYCSLQHQTLLLSPVTSTTGYCFCFGSIHPFILSGVISPLISSSILGTYRPGDFLFQYSCLENPMNSMKRQKDRTLKDELPRSVGAQYTTGDQRSNNSRKNEDNRVKAKTTLSCTLAGDGNKV